MRIIWFFVLISSFIISCSTINLGFKVNNEEFNCENIEDGDKKDGCYWEISIMKNIYYCDKIRNTSKLKYFCQKDMVRIAEEIRDENICAQLEDNELKDDCYYVIGPQKGDLDICNKIEEKETREDCIIEATIFIAKNKSDVSICETLQGTYGEDYCYDEFARNKSDETICEKINYEEDKDDCYKDIAISKEEENICEKIHNEKDRNWCKDSIIFLKTIQEVREKDNINICERMQDIKLKDSCYLVIAREKEEIEICSKIRNETLSEYCHSKTFK